MTKTQANWRRVICCGNCEFYSLSGYCGINNFETGTFCLCDNYLRSVE